MKQLHTVGGRTPDQKSQIGSIYRIQFMAYIRNMYLKRVLEVNVDFMIVVDLDYDIQSLPDMREAFFLILMCCVRMVKNAEN